MLWVSRSIVAAFGNFAQFPASAQGSCPNRASTERMVSGDPFNSVPTSANRNAFKPEFLNANASAAAMLSIPIPNALTDDACRWTLQDAPEPGGSGCVGGVIHIVG